MKGEVWLLFLVSTCCFISFAKSGKVEVTKIKIDIGGAECVDPEDCNNNGECKPTDSGKGICSCSVKFSGPNCGVPLKDPIGKVLPAAKDKGKGAAKRARVHNSTTATKRKLEYDPSSNIFGLSPSSLADAEQPFLIYNPDKRTYCFVSFDIKLTGKHNPYVEARSDRLGARNVFKFVKVPGADDKFYIHNKDQNKYIYVSNSKSGAFKYRNNNLLAAENIPTEPEQKKKFIFEFEDEDGDGFYKIKNDGKYIYVSSQLYGIPAYALLKATDQKELDRWSSQYFQFTLRDKAKEVVFKITGDEKPKDMALNTMIDNRQSSKVCYKGKEGDAEQDTRIEFKDDFVETQTHTKTVGFTFNGGLKATYGTASFTYTNTEATADTQTVTKSTTKAVSLKIAVNKCACIKITFKSMEYTQPYVLEAKTKEGKTVQATGSIEGQRYSDFEAHSEMFDYRDNFKCPHEN